MTTTKINTVITIDLKEYARLKAIEQAALEAVENTVFYDPECDDCMGVADGENHSHECLVIKLSNLLDGEK